MAQLVATRLPARRSAVIGDVGMAAALLLTMPVLLTHRWPLVFAAAALLGATFGLGFGGSLRHLSDVVPADKRGETMSAFYLLAYTAMALPTIAAGWAATQWPLAQVFPWFAAIVALACLAAAAGGPQAGESVAPGVLIWAASHGSASESARSANCQVWKLMMRCTEQEMPTVLRRRAQIIGRAGLVGVA